MKTQESLLIVDDQENMCWILSKIFTREGLNVRTSFTASDALRKIQGGEKFSIAIIDYRLPDMDGLCLMEKIKSKCPDISVIIITSFGSDELKEKAITSGAIAYFDKPFDNKKMADTVKIAMEKRRNKFHAKGKVDPAS